MASAACSILLPHRLEPPSSLPAAGDALAKRRRLADCGAAYQRGLAISVRLGDAARALSFRSRLVALGMPPQRKKTPPGAAPGDPAEAVPPAAAVPGTEPAGAERARGAAGTAAGAPVAPASDATAEIGRAHV